MLCSIFRQVVVFGLLLCSNVSPLLLLNLSYLTVFGKFEDYQSWLSRRASCVKCGGPVNKMSGLICGNFGINRTDGYICKGLWHAKCYRQHENDNFPVMYTANLDDCILDDEALEEEDEDRFKTG